MAGVKSGTLYAQAARTTAQTGDVIDNDIGAQALYVMFSVTVDPSTASVTPTIQGRLNADCPWYTLLAGAAKADVADTMLRIDPRLTASGNLIAKDAVPTQFRVNVAVADAESITYGVTYALLA